MSRKAPMTAAEAMEIVAEMRRKTSRIARTQLMKRAIISGNLTPEAKSVYAAELAAG